MTAQTGTTQPTKLLDRPWFRSFRAWLRGVLRPRAWPGVAVAVFAGTGIGFFLELLLIGAPWVWSAWLIVFALLTLIALFVVGCQSYHQVRAASDAGLFIHLAPLPLEKWRSRHEGDREGLQRWVALNWPGAVVLPSRITVAMLDGSPDGTRPSPEAVNAQLDGAIDQLQEILKTRTSLMPNASSINLLIGARSDVAVQLGVRCALLLPDEFFLVADARDADSIDGYLRYRVTGPNLAQTSTEPGATVVYLGFDAGSAGAPKAVADRLGATYLPLELNSLTTTPADYEVALGKVVAHVGRVETKGLILIGNGPQSLMFAAALMATRLGYAVQSLEFVGTPQNGVYDEIPPDAAASGVARAPSQAPTIIHPRTPALMEAVGVVAPVVGTAAISLPAQWFLGQTHAADSYASVIPGASVVAVVIFVVSFAVTMVAGSWMWRRHTNPPFVIDFSTQPARRRPNYRVVHAPDHVRASAEPAVIAAWIKDRIGDVHAAAPAVVDVSVDLSGTDSDEKTRDRWEKVAHEVRIGTRTNVPVDFVRGQHRVTLIKQGDSLSVLWQ